MFAENRMSVENNFVTKGVNIVMIEEVSFSLSNFSNVSTTRIRIAFGEWNFLKPSMLAWKRYCLIQLWN